MPQEFDGLEGVGDDELNAAANRLIPGGPDRPRSSTPREADPREEQNGTAADPQPLYEVLGYETPEAAVSSMHELRRNRSMQETEKNEWRERAIAAEARLGAPSSDRMSPRAQMTAHGEPAVDPLDTLESDFHVDKRLLAEAIDRRAEARFQALLQPLVEMTQADQKMVDQYGPEYVRVKPQIDAFVASDPHTARVVASARERGMPEVAAEYALKAYQEAVISSTHGQLRDTAEAGADARARSRRVAAPMQGRENARALLARQQAGGGGIDMAEAIARANRGDERLIDARFAEELPSEEHFQRVWRGGMG